MTNQNRKRRERPETSSYRAPAQAEPRRGLLDSLFAPRGLGASPMPKIRTSFARGFVTMLSTPVFVAGVPLIVLAVWLILLAGGFQGPFAWLGGTFAVPPLGTIADGLVSSFTFGGATMFGFLGLMLFRAVLMALIATVSVERMRTGTVTAWAARRTLRVLPVTIIVNLLGFFFLSVGQILGSLLGLGLGTLALVGAILVAVYATAFAPAIAADEDRPLPSTMQRAWRSAKMPGSGNLTFAALYAVSMLAALWAPLPGSLIGVNPPATAWVSALALNLLHVAVQATFVFRYLSVASEVPEAPQPPPRQARRR